MTPRLEDLKAKDLMTHNVLTVEDDWLLDRLAEFFVNHGISGAPVSDEDGKLIGVVSLSDLARFQSLPIGDLREDNVSSYYHPVEEMHIAREEFSGFRVNTETLVTVRDIMTPAIFNVDEESSILQVAETMLKGRIHRLLVTHHGEVTGIISSFDLLRAFQDYADRE